MELEIDFTGIEELNAMHDLLKDKFGFPDFYGKNVNALVDCLTSLRFPKDGMTKIVLNENETLELTIKSFPLHQEIIVNHFLVAIHSVNQRYRIRGESIPIGLYFV